MINPETKIKQKGRGSPCCWVGGGVLVVGGGLVGFFLVLLKDDKKEERFEKQSYDRRGTRAHPGGQ